VLGALLIATAAAASPEPERSGAADAPDAGSFATVARGGAPSAPDAPDAGSFATAAAASPKLGGRAAPGPGPSGPGGRRWRPAAPEGRGGGGEGAPGPWGDQTRAVMSMRGVSSVPSGVPSRVVRGSSPASTALFIDGVEVPLLFHMFIGPSVIHPDLVDSLAL